jgi:glycosyltransferase involved in cell wall biosynthesis
LNSFSPKISVICTCFNHEKFIEESLKSVVNQTYQNFELIVVDDASKDESVWVIEKFLGDHPNTTFIPLEKNIGICKAFNTGLKTSTGDLIIDLAGDDILLPDRLQKGVEAFANLESTYGVIFSDAEWIDGNGNHLYFHSDKYAHHSIPQGNIYKDLVERYFICSPTMMFRRSVLEALNGYDESLTYEDFDFWIRSSRAFLYHYDPIVLVKKRKLKNSLSHDQFKLFNKHNFTTYNVCCKILTLNKNITEQRALSKRIYYEIRQCMRTLDISSALKYSLLLIRNNSLKY